MNKDSKELRQFYTLAAERAMQNPDIELSMLLKDQAQIAGCWQCGRDTVHEKTRDGKWQCTYCTNKQR